MAIPPKPAAIAPTSTAELDAALSELRANADRFARLSPMDYVGLLESIRVGYHRIAEAQVAAACGAKRIDMDTPVAGEEWLGGPMTVLRNVRLVEETLRAIATDGHPKLLKERTLPNGQRAVRAFPGDLRDKLMFAAFEAWVWLEPGEEQGGLADHMAEHYRTPPSKGYVSLVLGAGNVASIAPMDAIYKMFTERRVVILKMNPVNEYLGPFIEQAFKGVIDEGFLRVVYGGAAVGSYLCYHAEVDDVHITGSDITHDIIVWGPPGEEREQRKREHNPKLNKPISSELGNVSPVMIIPGAYTEAELRFMAENVATQLSNNGGFNCNAAKLLVTAGGWAQRDRFIELLKQVLASVPPRVAYYPGAPDRHATFTEGHKVDLIGEAKDAGALQWALIRDLDPNDTTQRCFSAEAFCGVLGETALDATTAVEFLAKAVPFANDVVWGTLNCCLFVAPADENKPEVSRALDDAIAALRFGAVVINHWPALAYGFVTTPWGGYAGATLEDVQSGIGWVHNAYMLDRPQKSVIRGPLMVKPKPAWFRTNKNTHNIGKKLTDFEASGSYFDIPGVVLQALKG